MPKINLNKPPASSEFVGPPEPISQVVKARVIATCEAETYKTLWGRELAEGETVRIENGFIIVKS